MYRQHQNRRAATGQGGFTLVELMVTVALAAMLMAMAYPSFTSLTNNSRLTSAANEFVAAIQLARTEAIRLNRRVALCPSNADGSACQDGGDWTRWLTLVVDTGEVLRSGDIRAPIAVNASANIQGNPNGIVFRPDGYARLPNGLLLQATIAPCLPTDRPPTNVRNVRIDGGSRVNVEAVDAAGVCDVPGDAP